MPSVHSTEPFLAARFSSLRPPRQGLTFPLDGTPAFGKALPRIKTVQPKSVHENPCPNRWTPLERFVGILATCSGSNVTIVTQKSVLCTRMQGNLSLQVVSLYISTQGLSQAREWASAFFYWYNNRHYHTGLALMTPAQVHYGRVAEVLAQRQEVLLAAYQAHPERFVQGRPHPAEPPKEVWINKPRTENEPPRTEQNKNARA